MKNVILSKILLLLSLTLFLGSCNKEEEDTTTHDLAGAWRVVAYVDYVTLTKITKTNENTSPYINGDVTVFFTKTDWKDGVFSGKNFSNNFSGKYSIDLKGGVKIESYEGTKIYEPEWGQLFHSILNAESYEVKDNLLIFYYNQRRNSIILERYYPVELH